MGDSYAEVIVHDEKDTKGLQLKIGLILVTVALICFGAMYSITLFMLGIIMIPVTVISIKNRYREYEYLLVSDELEITLIKNKMRRKKLKTFMLAEMQCMAPVKSHRLDGFHGNPQLKVQDYSSGNQEHQIFGMIFSSEGSFQEVKVEPTEAMLKEVKMRHPSVVFFD